VLEPQASRLTALLGYDHVPVDGCSRVFGGTEYNRQAGRPWSQRKRSNFMVVPRFGFLCATSVPLCLLRNSLHAKRGFGLLAAWPLPRAESLWLSSLQL